jgi:hypothetical protein
VSEGESPRRARVGVVGGALISPASTWRTCSSSASSRASKIASGRSAGAAPRRRCFDHALPLSDAANGIEVADVRAEIERLVMLRSDLRSLGQVIHELSPDQRLVLVSLAGEEMECADFCERHGWSREKYRKVSQRARARLRELLEACEETFPRRMSRLGAAVGEEDRELL